MVEDIVLDVFPKESGVYLFKVNNEIIYIGSSKNLYMRMMSHINCIRQGSVLGYKQDLYQFLQSNTFVVEFQITVNYRQLEQQLIEKYNPRYNAIRAYTGCGTYKGREAEYMKEYRNKYQNEYQKTKKQQESHRKANNKYYNQLCLFNGQTITLNALSSRFRRQGLSNPTIEAKKYLIKETKTPIEFYDVYP